MSVCVCMCVCSGAALYCYSILIIEKAPDRVTCGAAGSGNIYYWPVVGSDYNCGKHARKLCVVFLFVSDFMNDEWFDELSEDLFFFAGYE